MNSIVDITIIAVTRAQPSSTREPAAHDVGPVHVRGVEAHVTEIEFEVVWSPPMSRMTTVKECEPAVLARNAKVACCDQSCATVVPSRKRK